MIDVSGPVGTFLIALVTGSVGTSIVRAMLSRMSESRRIREGRETEASRLRTKIDDARASMAALVVLAIRYGAPKADADGLLPEWWHENVPEARRAPHPSPDSEE